MKPNYYEILGVDRSASDQEIRDRFRQLARENHPDRYHGDDKADAERKFQTLTEAMNILTNPAKRQQHDSEIALGGGRGNVDFALTGRKYFAMGAKALKEGDLQAAYENFDLAVKHNPNDSKALHHLARTARRLPGRERQAVQAIEAAVQREPMNAIFLKDAGMICRQAGLAAKAERYLEEALTWDSADPEIQAALAQLREAKEAGKGGFSIFGKR